MDTLACFSGDFFIRVWGPGRWSSLIFVSFTLVVCKGKKKLPKLSNSQEPEPHGAACFWPLGAGVWRKKYQEAEPKPGAVWEINQKPEPLGKKSGAGAGSLPYHFYTNIVTKKPEQCPVPAWLRKSWL